MKCEKIMLLSIIGMLTMIVGSICLFKLNRTDMSFVKSGEVVFKNDTLNISAPLSESDLFEIINILDGKMLYKDNPSCSFNNNIAIKFNSGTQIFC
ncbi:MAG: hypothetical protein J6K88_00945, partial [Oscillospiraceae bacterium]|nr:hypothetical protein [Oscillospiraceae bacterium]